MKKTIFAIVCCTVFGASAYAQELNAWLNGGWQGLSYKVQNGQSSLSPGGSAGLGFTFPVASHWGLIIGLTGGTYGTRSSLQNGRYTTNQVDNTASAFYYNVNTVGYTEMQRFFSLGVPLMLQYHTTGAKTHEYLNIGRKRLMSIFFQLRC